MCSNGDQWRGQGKNQLCITCVCCGHLVTNTSVKQPCRQWVRRVWDTALERERVLLFCGAHDITEMLDLCDERRRLAHNNNYNPADACLALAMLRRIKNGATTTASKMLNICLSQRCARIFKWETNFSSKHCAVRRAGRSLAYSSLISAARDV